MSRVFPFLAMIVVVAACQDEMVTNLVDVQRPAIPAVSHGQVVTLVTGSWAVNGVRTFAFTARRYADGTVGGEWKRVNQPNPNHGDIVCLNIVGNQAWIGTIEERGTYAPGEGGFRVIDNGEGENAPPDQMSKQFVGAGAGFAKAYCASTLAAPDLNDVGAGAIQIR